MESDSLGRDMAGASLQLPFLVNHSAYLVGGGDQYGSITVNR